MDSLRRAYGVPDSIGFARVHSFATSDRSVQLDLRGKLWPRVLSDWRGFTPAREGVAGYIRIRLTARIVVAGFIRFGVDSLGRS